MKKKIGIITISGNYNYGNRLQNYAMQEVYKKMGFEVESIWSTVDLNDKPVISFKQKIKDHIKPFLGKINYNKYAIDRFDNFEKFTNKYINKSNYIITSDDDNTLLNDMYDYFSVGSDQVWNCSFKKINNYEFLLFADKKKTLSYAASFGITNIPKSEKRLYVKGLEHIKNISVREDAGAKIVKDLIGREPIVVLDPTMLLDKNDWIHIEEKPKNMPRKNYILTYFLDEICDEKKKYIKDIAKENNLDIVDLTNVGNYNCLKHYSDNPSNFIYLLHNAKCIFTDSFHACVFSILFEKPFLIFNREGHMENMNSRLDTLLGNFKLKDRKIEILSDINKINIFKIDYKTKDDKLYQLRKKSYDFIYDSLNIDMEKRNYD